MKHVSLLLAGTALIMAACAPDEPAPTPESTPTETPEVEASEAPAPEANEVPPLLQAEGRTEEDRERDSDRKPGRTLAFIGIDEGDTVLEMEAGGGYFTPFLAYTVGSEGTVYMQNPPAFANFWGGGDPPRLANLPEQVEYVASDFDDMSAIPDASVDVITWMQGPHEIWYQPDGMDAQLAEPDLTFEEIARVLKPGGVFVALDHAAPAGTAESSGGDTHRIDPEIIDTLATSKGLTRLEDSDLFANPEDDMTTNVFDPTIRGKTNQFFVKYQKPSE